MSSKGFIVGGAGGAPLNFKIVGGTEQPAQPKENTIWVNTENEISSWVCSPVQPAEPAEGMVWIKTGYNSNVLVEALKKNSIALYILNAHQYVAEAWAVCSCSVFQNEVWTDTRYWLVKDGQPQYDILGSFKKSKYGSYDSTGSVTYKTDHILLSCGQYASVQITSENNIKSSVYSTLCVEVNLASSNSNGGDINYVALGSASAKGKYPTQGLRTIDITNVTSDNPLILRCTRGNAEGTSTAKFYNVWLE